MKQSLDRRIRKSNKPCPFCETKKEPDYKDVKALEIGLSPKKRIVSRRYTGVCQKHQRRLTSAIKQARHLALLPFVDRV